MTRSSEALPAGDDSPVASRRAFLRRAGGGFGAIAAAWLIEHDRARAGSSPAATTSRPAHFPPRATRVIYLFMHGGPSHLETFDPKPDLQRLAGQPLPASFGRVATRRQVAANPLLGDAADVPTVPARAGSRSPTSCRTSPSAPTTWR